MTGQRMDFMEFKKSMIDQFGDLGFTEEELMSEVRRLKILRFDLDKKGLNIVSQFEGTIVFIDPKYDGEQVNRGEIWLCSIRSVSTVYNAIPLRRINASILMGLDEGMRRSIVDSLWKSNRVQFEEIFKERYSEEVYARAYAEASEKYISQIREKDARITELERNLNQSMYMIRSRSPTEQQDGIQLRSDDVVETEPEKPVEKPSSYVASPSTGDAPVFQWRDGYVAPGVPELRYWDEPRNSGPEYRFDIERVAPDTLRCGGFPDGKYFVHISPRKNILVIRKHNFGSALCIEGRMRLEGLGELVPFTQKEMVVSEYNRKYDGVLVHL